MKSNNFRDIWTVAKFTMQDMVSRKSFRISTIIILILIVVGFNLPNIFNTINPEPDYDTVLIIDQDHLLGDTPTISKNLKIVEISDDEAREKVKNGEANSAVIIKMTDKYTPELRYIVKNLVTADEFPTDIYHELMQNLSIAQAKKLNLSAEEIKQIFPPSYSFPVEQVDDKEVGGNLGVMMLLSVLLFFAIYFCAFQVSSSITIEKTSKIMETLVTSTSPRSIIIGKTIGVGIVGLLQILLFVITAVLSANAFLDPEILNSLLDLSNFTPYLALITFIYFILGYFAYALLYAVTGSTVAKPEDIQAANTPVMIITMIGFYFSYFTMMDPTSNLANIAALLPISSPFCMPIRIMMGIASGWEVLASIAILLVFCAIIARIAIKIYSSAILNYGTRMTLSDMIKTYKEK